MIPTINAALKINIANYMLVESAIVYYVLGQYLALSDSKFGVLPFVILPMSILALFTIAICGVCVYIYSPLLDVAMMGNNIFRIMAAASLFIIVKNYFCHPHHNRIIESGSTLYSILERLNRYSFGIYLVHPFFINLIYKVLKITPMSGNVGLMTIILFVIVYVASLFLSFVLTKIPLLNKYV